MNFKRIMLVAVLGLLACPSLASAQKSDVNDLVARMPWEMEVVVASPNLPQALAGLRQWVGTLGDIPVDAAKSAGMMLETVESVSGPAAMGFRTEEPLAFLGFAAAADDPEKVVQALLQHGHAIENGMIAFGPEGREWGFCALRNGLLVFGSSAALVTAEYPVVPEKGFSADPGIQWLLKHPDTAKAHLFILKRAGDIAAFAKLRQPGGRADAIMGALSNALRLNEVDQAPSVAMLDFYETGFALTDLSLKRIPDENDKPIAVPRVDGLDAGFESWPIRLAVSGLSLDDIVGAVEAAETRFDPDVGAEFREEMAELDADLGFGFREDFLGSLGDDWAVLVGQVEGAPQWALWSKVADARAFLDGARAVAKLAEEPWQEGTNPGDRGGWVVNTRAFGTPLTLTVHDRQLAVGNGMEAARAAFRPVEPEVVGDNGPSHTRVCAVVGLSALGEMLEKRSLVGPVGASWAALPTDATMTLGFADLDYGRQITLSLDGVRTWDINSFLTPFLGKLQDARTQVQIEGCKTNIRHILKAATVYQDDHQKQWPPNLQALFPKYLSKESVLVCPATGKKSSYRFLGSVPSRLAFSSCPMVYDLAGNHPGGRNVGFYDGHVWYYEESVFKFVMSAAFRHLEREIAQARERGEKVDIDMKAAKEFFTDFGTIE